MANFNLAYDFRNEHFTTTTPFIMETELANLKCREQKLTASISQFHLLNMSTTLGVSLISTHFDKSSMDETVFDIWFTPNRFVTPFFNFKYDNLDDPYFARHGLYANLNTHYYWDPNDGSNNNFDFSFALQYHFTPMNGRLTIIPQAYGRYFLNETFFYNLRNRCGGEIEGRHFENQLPFIGISYMETFGEAPTFLKIARCDLQYNVFGKHYITAIYNALNLHNYYFHGAGLKYSYNSPIGPVSLLAQWSNLYNSKFSLYFSFGYTF